MSQYKTGTATFTNGSATVTGSGTAWLNNVSSGDYIVRVGDVVSYEVASVVSDTSLTLTANYGGVTGSGLSYVAHKDFHPNGAPKWANGDVEFAAIQNRWNAQLLAGTYGTAALVATGTGAGDVPLNSDLGTAAYLNTGTAAGELPTNGDLPTFGTAATADLTTSPSDATAGRALATDSDVYRPANILGTVSQVGGVPTGAIIESYEVGNSRVIKYADGTMIINYSITASTAVNTPLGSSYRSNGQSMATFPEAFQAPPVYLCHCGPTPNNFNRLVTVAIAGNPSVTGSPGFYIISPVSLSSGDFIYTHTAIGRWTA